MTGAVPAQRVAVPAPLGPSEETLAAVAIVPTANVCDDCGKEATVTVLTDYGARYCRRCLQGR
ncbi:MAG: hypothetical protein WCG85_27050 [Polyangia bacterium]